MDLVLRQNLAGPTFATNIALRGVPPSEPTLESQFVDVYWKFDDDPAMEPIYLGRGNAGETLNVPFDLKGRTIRLFAASVTEDAQRLISDFSKMVQTTFDKAPTPEDASVGFEATEDIDAGMFVNVYNASGTAKIRKANATDNTKPADGFIIADVANGDSVEVYFGGKLNTALTGLTPGATYFLSTTGGDVTITAPTGSGNIQQIIGEAVSDTAIQFEPQPYIEKA